MTTEILTETGEVTELSTTEDFGQGLAFVSPTDFPDLDSADAGISIKPDYIEFKSAGEIVRGVFNGISEIKTKDRLNPGQYKLIPAIVLQTKDGVKLNAGANLVSQLQNIAPGTAIQIMFKGEEETKSGNHVKAYEVRLLNLPRVNVAFLPTVNKPVAAPALPAPAPVVETEQEIEIVDTLHFWAVTEAAKFWNIEAGDAARAIGKAQLGKMSKADFLAWLKNPNGE